MQTQFVLLRSLLERTKHNQKRNQKHTQNHLLIVAALMAITMLLSACSSTKELKNNNLHSLQNHEPCYKIMQKAKSSQEKVDKKINNLTSKDLKNASDTWKKVAVQCNSRFAQGVVFSAQNIWKLANLNQTGNAETIKLAEQLELNAYKKIQDFADNNKNLYWNHDPLAKAAVAQDKLAFLLQTLAARDAKNVSLRQSDMTATISNTLMHFASNGSDLRQKVYEIPQQNLESGIAKDNATGKELPIVSIAYMDCAREELAALNQTIFPINKDGKINNDAIVSIENQDFIGVLADIVVSHIISAYSNGYPTDDSAIFEQ